MATVGGPADAGIYLSGSKTTAMADANQTVPTTDSPVSADNRTQITTGALTAQRNLVLPLEDGREYVIINQCTGFGVQVIGATGTGIVVGAGKTAIVRTDGVNYSRVTADV